MDSIVDQISKNTFFPKSHPGPRYRSQQLQPPHLRHVRVRAMRLEDAAKLDALAAHERFDIGVQNVELYFKHSPKSWFVAEDERTGELVASDSYNCLGNGIYHGWQIHVREDYKSKGVSALFTTMKNADFPYCGNCTQDSLLRFAVNNILVWKVNEFRGPISEELLYEPALPLPAGHLLLELRPNLLEKLCEYDRNIIGTLQIDRRKFLKDWTLADDQRIAYTLVAFDEATQTICGYGTLRRFSNYVGLMPCYADSPEIGEHLLVSLVAKFFRIFPEKIDFLIAALAENRTTMKLAALLKMKHDTTEIHGYRMSQELYETRFRGKIDRTKVFAIHEYWPI